MISTLAFTGDDAADELLRTNPLAVMVGMLLDQQVAIEWAFASPAKLADRLDGSLSVDSVIAAGEERLVELFAVKPALHRYPASMARRTLAMCEHLATEYDGDPVQVWTDVVDAKELRKRLLAIPGYGKQKVQIFVAVLAKRMNVTPEGWEAVAGHYAEPGHHSVADLDSPEALAALREHRAAIKAGKATST